LDLADKKEGMGKNQKDTLSLINDKKRFVTGWWGGREERLKRGVDLSDKKEKETEERAGSGGILSGKRLLDLAVRGNRYKPTKDLTGGGQKIQMSSRFLFFFTAQVGRRRN